MRLIEKYTVTVGGVLGQDDLEETFTGASNAPCQAGSYAPGRVPDGQLQAL